MALVAGAFAATVLATALSARSNPPLPFESTFAAARGDRSILRFNDFVGRVPAHRVVRLLRSGNVLGDRVLLDCGVSIYFPDGYIVSTRTEFEKYKPKPGLAASQVRHRAHLVRDDRYDLRNAFDDLLGAVCAETTLQRGLLRLRRGESGVLSLVSVQPGHFDVWTGESTWSYVVISTLDPYFLGRTAATTELIDACRDGRG